MSEIKGKKVAVVGIGAMGGGMARALLDSDATSAVIGYDKSVTAMDKFFGEAQTMQKAPPKIPASLKEAVSEAVDFVVLSLVNEGQCEEVCFGGEENLLNTLSRDTCVVMTSTVTATWAQKADKAFRDAGILFVDCPVSGGPARARQGDLTLIASGEANCLDTSMPILNALAREVHVIKGGAGGGSTVKCVHQLLAGVHICAAAEAMAMAAKAGIDVSQLYDIVNGAAGASWMFTDRGKRMLEEDPEVKSALAIFVKDLDIVYAEAKRLMSPIPVASAALQQFISGQSLGLGRADDSQVVKVYEQLTGTKVVGSPNLEKDLAFQNNFVKAWTTTGETKTTALSTKPNYIELCWSGVKFDIEVLRAAPSLSGKGFPLSKEYEIVLETNAVRVHKFLLPAGQSADFSFSFFHLICTASEASVEYSISSANWTESIPALSAKWSPPVAHCSVLNVGNVSLEQMIVEIL